MIKSIIFDIGNVLLPFDFTVALRKLREKSDEESLMQTMEPVKFAYESGQIGRADFIARMRDVLHYTGSEAEFTAVWEDIFTENRPMLDLVRALHPRYPLYLLSNTSDLHMDYIFKMYPDFRLFRDAVYSYKVKCFKPDPRIYEAAQRQFGIAPHETLFIDDLAPNIEAAARLGFNAVLYDHKRHEDLEARLQELGVV